MAVVRAGPDLWIGTYSSWLAEMGPALSEMSSLVKSISDLTDAVLNKIYCH